MGGTPSGIYRPPQQAQPAMVALTVTPTAGQGATPAGSALQPTGAVDTAGNPVYGASVSGSTQTTYIFDAVMTLDHEQEVELTRHPVQTGAAVSSHAYVNPARITLDVGMSDAMAAYSTGVNDAAAFTGNQSKSVSAYQEMISLLYARQLCKLTTRLRTYDSVVVTSVSPQESHKTIAGLRMRVTLTQVFLAGTVTTAVTARPDTGAASDQGNTNPTPLSSTTQQQFTPAYLGSTALGGGSLSSNSTVSA